MFKTMTPDAAADLPLSRSKGAYRRIDLSPEVAEILERTSDFRASLPEAFVPSPLATFDN